MLYESLLSIYDHKIVNIQSQIYNFLKHIIIHNDKQIQ